MEHYVGMYLRCVGVLFQLRGLEGDHPPGDEQELNANNSTGIDRDSREIVKGDAQCSWTVDSGKTIKEGVFERLIAYHLGQNFQAATSIEIPWILRIENSEYVRMNV